MADELDDLEQKIDIILENIELRKREQVLKQENLILKRKIKRDKSMKRFLYGGLVLNALLGTLLGYAVTKSIDDKLLAEETAPHAVLQQEVENPAPEAHLKQKEQQEIKYSFDTLHKFEFSQPFYFTLFKLLNKPVMTVYEPCERRVHVFANEHYSSQYLPPGIAVGAEAAQLYGREYGFNSRREGCSPIRIGEVKAKAVKTKSGIQLQQTVIDIDNLDGTSTRYIIRLVDVGMVGVPIQAALHFGERYKIQKNTFKRRKCDPPTRGRLTEHINSVLEKLGPQFGYDTFSLLSQKLQRERPTHYTLFNDEATKIRADFGLVVLVGNVKLPAGKCRDLPVAAFNNTEEAIILGNLCEDATLEQVGRIPYSRYGFTRETSSSIIEHLSLRDSLYCLKRGLSNIKRIDLSQYRRTDWADNETYSFPKIKPEEESVFDTRYLNLLKKYRELAYTTSRISMEEENLGNVTDVLTPAEINEFLQEARKIHFQCERDYSLLDVVTAPPPPECDVSLGLLVSKLIQNSYERGYNGFTLKTGNEFFPDYLCAFLTGAGERRITVTIDGSCGDYCGYGSENLYLKIDGNTGFHFGSAMGDSSSIITGNASGYVGESSKDSSFTIGINAGDCLGHRSKGSTYIVAGKEVPVENVGDCDPPRPTDL